MSINNNYVIIIIIMYVFTSCLQYVEEEGNIKY